MYHNVPEDLEIKQTPPLEPQTLHVTSQGTINMVGFLATSNLYMELNLGRTDFENAD
jgi:hypothetical protein